MASDSITASHDDAALQNLLTPVFTTIGERLMTHGVVVTVEHDFDKRLRDMADAQEWHDRDTPMFDTAHSTLGRHNGVWLKFRERRSDDIVGTIAARAYGRCKVRDLFETSRLMYDGTKPPGRHRLSLLTRECDHLTGRIVWGGSGWVRPDYRGKHLPLFMVDLLHAVLLQDFGLDYFIGCVHPNHARIGLPVRGWAMTHLHRGVVWHHPTRGDDPLWLVYKTGAEILEELEGYALTGRANRMDESEPRSARPPQT